MATNRPEFEEPLVQLATRVPKSLHQAIKLYCVRADRSIAEFVTEAVRERLRKLTPRRT
jgi:hypothetical protein